MFIVINDPPAGDDLALFLSSHGCRAWKRTAFVVQIDATASESDVKRLLASWRSAREGVVTELMTPSPGEDLTRV